ncbi:MAG: hypothetical protein ACRCYO_10355, partial [Bacteroidia bacterium]
ETGCCCWALICTDKNMFFVNEFFGHGTKIGNVVVLWFGFTLLHKSPTRLQRGGLRFAFVTRTLEF